MTSYTREWSPVGLALSCVLAALALCLRTDNQLLRAYDLEGVGGLFEISFLVGVVVLCLLVFASAHDEERRRWSIGVGLMTGCAGVGFALFVQVLPSVVSAIGSGVLLGFSLACLLRQWGRYYRLFSPQGALLNTMLSFLAASCWWFVVVHAGTPFLFCLGLLALLFCGSLPLLARQIVDAAEIRAGFRDEIRMKPLSTMRQVMRMGWAAVAGLMLNFFTVGMTFLPGEAGLSVAGVSPKPLSYGLLTVAVWVIVSRSHNAMGGILSVFYRASLPIAAVIMLATPFLDAVLPTSGSLAFSVVSYLGIAVCNVLGLVILFWTAKSSEVAFSKVFATFCASCAASVAAGMVVFFLFGTSAKMVSLCLLALYLLAMLATEVKVGIARAKKNAPGLADDAE